MATTGKSLDEILNACFDATNNRLGISVTGLTASATTWTLDRNLTLSAGKYLTVTNQLIQTDGAFAFQKATIVSTPTGTSLIINSFDTGVGLVHTFSSVGAADPYILIGRSDTGVATNAVTDMLILQAGAGSTNVAANFGLGVSFKLSNDAHEVEERGYIDAVLTVATNGSEYTRLDFGLMANGGAVNPISIASDCLNINTNADLGSTTDKVLIGAYDLSAGHRTLALATETAVAADVGLASTHSLTVRINGASYKIPLTSA